MGCQSTTSQKNLSPPVFKPESEIRLAPGDTIAVKFPYTTQLNDINETHTILPDGTITMALAGQVMAAGKTPTELQNELVKRHPGQLQNPVITVSVTSLFERKVYVGGEVMRPGLVTLPGQMSVMEAIFQAGGFNMDKAETKNVVLIRLQGTQRVAYALDFDKALQGDTHEPVYLQPQDIVYVPRTTIVNVGLWVRQHLYDLLPNIAFGYRLDSSD
jgi:protein involved in polysaccharide export with SLBB domain